MEKIKFTRRQREKLRDLGWNKHFSYEEKDVVRTGEGKYSKQFGKVWITIVIENHLIQRFQTSLIFQTTNTDFAFSLAEDLKRGLIEIKSLNYFN